MKLNLMNLEPCFIIIRFAGFCSSCKSYPKVLIESKNIFCNKLCKLQRSQQNTTKYVNRCDLYPFILIRSTYLYQLSRKRTVQVIKYDGCEEVWTAQYNFHESFWEIFFSSTYKTFIMVYIEDYCIKCHICFDLEEIKPYFDAIETIPSFIWDATKSNWYSSHSPPLLRQVQHSERDWYKCVLNG